MKILFVTHPYPNYVPDLLLHGLRKLLGTAVVEFPRKDCLYDGILGLGICPDDQRCPDWFPNDEGQVDRNDVWGKIKKGFFDLTICDLRAVSFLLRHLDKWPDKCVLVDGEDHAQHIPSGPYVVCRRETDGSDFSIPLPMGIPEELLVWINRYDNLPKKYSIGFLGSTHDGFRKRLLNELNRYYPDTLFQATPVPSDEQPVPSGRFGRDEYYRHLQQCRIVLSLAGAGYDTFRFWENASMNAVHAATHMPLFIPDDFIDNHEILRFDTLETLRRKIDTLLASEQKLLDLIICGRYKLINSHLTVHRARYFIDRIKRLF